MVTSVVAATERCQREERKAATDSASLKASIHTEVRQTGGPEKPEEREQLQPARQLKPKPKPKLYPAPTPKPRTTSTATVEMTSVPVPSPTRRWETI